MIVTSGIAVSGLGIDARLSRRAQEVVDEGGETRASSERRLVIWSGPPPGAADWLPPVFAWIESDARNPEAVLDIVARAREPDLFLSLSAASAHPLDPAPLLTRAIVARRAVPNEIRDDIELVLQEALSNAVVRGDLGVEGPRSPSIEDFDRHAAQVAERLEDPRYGSRRIETAVSIAPDHVAIEIRDEGDGFDPARSARAPRDAPSGRGIDIIARVTRRHAWFDGGRRLRMEVAW